MPKQVNILVPVDADKLNVLRQFIAADGASIEAILAVAAEKLYTKHVPQAVRKYIEEKAEAW